MFKIITDTLACLPSEITEKYNISIIPQIINFGTQSYREGIDLDHKSFLEKLKLSKELPKTAAPPPEWFKEEFDKLIPLGETILCIHPSAELSGTVRSAKIAAQDYPKADIRVIDTRLIASPLGVIVKLAAEWAEAGVDADTITNRCEKIHERCQLYFLVDTLEYLMRGGRIGKASGLVGSLLQIKPILTLRDGFTDLYQRERTHKRALEHIKQKVRDAFPGQGKDYGFLQVLHAGIIDNAQKLANELMDEFGLENVPVVDMPPAIITHGGPGILGVAFFKKE